MKRRLLLLNARRGLGNRLRTVLSGLAYADATGCALQVVWAPNVQCGAGLDELWQHPFHLVSLKRARYTAALCGGWEDHLDEDDLDLGQWKRPALALQSSQPFSNPAGTPWISQLRRLRPLPELVERIDSVWNNMPPSGPLVGLMLRTHASAHRSTVVSRPLDHALRRLDEIHRLAPDATVFLSSDSPDGAAALGERHAVVALPGKGEFNSVRGVQDAVCDLYLLASCQWIIGSHASSFSEIAGLAAGHGGYETSVDPPIADLAARLAASRGTPHQFWD